MKNISVVGCFALGVEIPKSRKTEYPLTFTITFKETESDPIKEFMHYWAEQVSRTIMIPAEMLTPPIPQYSMGSSFCDDLKIPENNDAAIYYCNKL